MRLAITLALGAGAAMLLTACAPKKSPSMEPISVNQPKTEGEAREAATASAAQQADELSNLVSSLSEKAQNLPGRTAEAHRAAMHDVFDNLAQLLPILAGPEPSGEFRQQLRSVETARDRLAPDAGDINAEPAIGTGIRGSAGALENIVQDDDLFAGQDIADNLKKLSSTVDQLDTVAGVGRPYVAADAVQMMAQIAHQMADRITGGEASTAATTEPASTEPASTEPASTEPASTEPASTEPTPAAAAATAPIEPKPAELKAEGEKPASGPAPPPPQPAAEPNK